MSLPTFELPDLYASSPLSTFEFSPDTEGAAAALLAAPPAAIFQRFLRDQESETVLLAARRILHAFLASAAADGIGEDAEAIAAQVGEIRAELAATVGCLATKDPEVRQAVLRQRAPLGLIGGCWLDTVSQPATQPAVIVNHLLRHQFRLNGEGNPQRALLHLRRRALEGDGVYLPEVDASDYLARAEARPLTVWHALFYVSLARYPASFLPEVVGVHYALHALGVDDLLTGRPAGLPEPAVRELLAEYLALTQRSPEGPAPRRRLRTAVGLVLALEREHVALLDRLAAWLGGLSLDARVAAIVARHAPFAGRQHRNTSVGGRLLTETFADPDLDLAAFLTEFRRSNKLKRLPGGGCRFLTAIKFGGPMFGIFDEREAATLTSWVDAVHAGERPDIRIPVNDVGDDQATHWRDAVERSDPGDVAFVAAPPLDDRELFYRLVNIEHFPNTLATARQRAAQGFVDGEVLLTHGADGRYTDASYFEYSPEAFLARVDRIYWDKLIRPYRPLDEVPDRDQVVFGQTNLALGSLIDGAWAHRIGNLGRFQRRSDAMLYAIYADEMGRGDLRKNHITLIHQVLASLAVRLPHIRDAAFREQEALPDSPYNFSLHQLAMSLFPDSFYNEILGYNLAIEMYGLGELRMHEIQKLRRHGFDTAYEEAHLSIDNLSAGHSRQATDVIIAYLDDVRRHAGGTAVPAEWRRIWRGYAAFAFFAEHQLISTLPAQDASSDNLDELVI